MGRLKVWEDFDIFALTVGGYLCWDALVYEFCVT